MSDDTTHYIEVPADEVRRRAAEYLEWYNGGGREELRANRDREIRQARRDTLADATTGFFWWKRPLTEAERERKIEDYMSGGAGTFSFNGESIVNWYLSHRDNDAKEISTLHNTATGTLPMFIGIRIWSWIKAHSSEPGA